MDKLWGLKILVGHGMAVMAAATSGCGRGARNETHAGRIQAALKCLLIQVLAKKCTNGILLAVQAEDFQGSADVLDTWVMICFMLCSFLVARTAYNLPKRARSIQNRAME